MGGQHLSYICAQAQLSASNRPIHNMTRTHIYLTRGREASTTANAVDTCTGPGQGPKTRWKMGIALNELHKCNVEDMWGCGHACILCMHMHAYACICMHSIHAYAWICMHIMHAYACIVCMHMHAYHACTRMHIHAY